jgi:hypothetical protein
MMSQEQNDLIFRDVLREGAYFRKHASDYPKVSVWSANASAKAVHSLSPCGRGLG